MITIEFAGARVKSSNQTLGQHKQRCKRSHLERSCGLEFNRAAQKIIHWILHVTCCRL